MSHSQRRWWLVVFAVFLWLLAILPAYYGVHKPLGATHGLPQPQTTVVARNIVSAILSALADLCLVALTLVVVAAWGSRISRWLGVDLSSGLERWSLGAILGLGLLGTVVLLMGVARVLFQWFMLATLAVMGVLVWSEIRDLIRWLAGGIRRWRPTNFPWPWLYTGTMGLIALGWAMLPPTGWDALVYHLQGPRLYAEAHRLVAVPENFYLNWPAQVEMLLTWGLLLKGDILAKLFHWAFWVLNASLLYTFARRTAGTRTARWAVALWASVPFALELAGKAYVDLGLTAFVLAGTYALLQWTDSQRNGWLVLSTLFIGLAMAAKYTAVAWLALLGLVFVYHAWRHQRQSIGWIATRVVALGMLAGSLVVPWLVKNWIVTGNPIYPFLFGGAGWNPTREAWLTWTGHGYSRNPLDYLALPWLATILGTSGTAAFDATIGPLLLCLVPLVFLARGRPRAVNYGLALVGGQLVYFMATIYRYIYLVQTRLLLPAFPLLCMAAAFALCRLPTWDRKRLRLSRVVGSAVVLVLTLNLLTQVKAFLVTHPLPPLFGLESREEYLTRHLGAYAAAMRDINEQLPANAKILFLWEPRGYYAERPVLADATLDNLAQLRLSHGNAQAALMALQLQDFSHLLLYRAGLDSLRGPTPRPPTLGSLLGPTNPQQSFYPLTGEEMEFLATLVSHCQQVGSLGEIYEIYRLP